MAIKNSWCLFIFLFNTGGLDQVTATILSTICITLKLLQLAELHHRVPPFTVFLLDQRLHIVITKVQTLLSSKTLQSLETNSFQESTSNIRESINCHNLILAQTEILVGQVKKI